jgi:hypothetical protein
VKTSLPRLRDVALTLATVAFPALPAVAQCAVDQNVGTSLGLGDDAVSPPQPLGFQFPFAGANYDSVCVSSNGFLYLFDTTGALPAPTASLCCNGVVSTLLGSTSPMICGAWQDLNPSIGGTVNFNATTNRALITWLGVPEYGNASSALTFQIVLHSSGAIDMVFDAGIVNATHTVLTGWSPGNGALDPGAIDFSSLPIPSTSPTVYELFVATTCDLSSVRGFSATPLGANGWVVTPGTGCGTYATYGVGCPKPVDFYESFAPSTFDLSGGAIRFTANGTGGYLAIPCVGVCFDTNFSGNLNLGDDSLATGLALGFTFPFAGGTTTTIDVCSNGFIWLQSGSSTATDYSPTVAEFLGQSPRIAPLWTDLNPNIGGGVFFDALPGRALVTWNQVPAFGVPTSSNTFQLQLFPNGDFILAWTAAMNNATSAGGAAGITGFTLGNDAVNQGSIDLSTAVPFATGNGRPLRLDALAGTLPALGTTFTLEVRDMRTGTIAGALNLGTSNPDLDLSALGMPGCRQLSSILVSLPLVVSAARPTLPLAVPNDPTLTGLTLTTQAVMVDPSLGGLPIYLSNGLRMVVGR